MALIVCPDCKREVSDKATTCPNCGCPIEKLPKIDYEIDNDSTYCKACITCGSIYWNANADGYRNGYCIECRGKNSIDKLVKIDYTTVAFKRRVGDVPQYSGMGYSYHQHRIKEWTKRRNGVNRELFEKYVSHWDTLDKECAEYKNNIKELYENSVTVDEKETHLSNDTKTNIASGVLIAFIIISILCFIILGSKGCSSETNHNDGKCDICDKTKYSSINGEEFCYEHYKNAINYYLDD